MRLHETPWGTWIDASRIVAIEVEKVEAGWYVRVVLASSGVNDEVWSRPHTTRRDAKACADALVVALQPEAVNRSPYRAPYLGPYFRDDA